MDRAEVYSIAFNATSTFLACSSDKGTVHIFALAGSDKAAQVRRSRAWWWLRREWR